MAKLIIHYGMHKTGSSSIQASLHQNMPDDRFYYISMGGANQSAKVATLFLENPEKYPGHKKKGLSSSDIKDLQSKFKKKLQEEVVKAEGRTAILSGEKISTFASAELESLCNYFRRKNYDIVACGYVRSPKGYIESSFQEKVKGGLSSFVTDNQVPRYRRKFEHFDVVLGADNISFWQFNPREFPHGDVVLDFCQKIGLDFPLEHSKRVNESISLPALKLLYCHRKYGPKYKANKNVVKESNRLVRAVAELKGPKLRFHSTLVKPMIELHRDDVLWMEERMGASLSEDLEEGDNVAVRTEADLLALGDEETRWLASQLGPEYENSWMPNMKPEQVAKWMHLLRRKLIADSKAP